MRGRVLIAAVAAALGACLQDVAFESAGRRPIVGGQAEDGYPAVGLVRTPEGICSGTVVAPRIVVSAKHCIRANATPGQVQFSTGPNGETPAGTGERLFYTGVFANGTTIPPDDFLVIVLDRDAGVGRLPVSRAGVEGRQGALVDLVGYGKTSKNAADSGRKRSGQMTIGQIYGSTFAMDRGRNAAACGGDSGGPVILDGRLVGVTIGSDCNTVSTATRVDGYMDLLRQASQYLRGAAPGGTDGGERRRDPRDRQGQQQRGRRSSEGEGEDTCEWANDGVCDEPEICESGTDATDCADGGDVPDDGTCYCDAECEELGDCCTDCSEEPAECTCDTTWDCDLDDLDEAQCACDPECGADEQCYCDDQCVGAGDCCPDCPDDGGGDGDEQCFCDDQCVDAGDCCPDCPDGGGDDEEQCYCDDQCVDAGDCCAECPHDGDEQCYCDDQCVDAGDCCDDCPDGGDGGDGGECADWGGLCSCDDGTAVCCDDYDYTCTTEEDFAARCYCDDECTANGDCCDGCWVYDDDWT